MSRLLGNFKNTTSPFAALVCFNAETNLPEFALCYNSLGVLDNTDILLNGNTVPLVGQLDSLKFNSTRPQDGGGLIRRSITANIKSDGPFTRGIWTKKYYIGGQSEKDFYFGVYSTDLSTYQNDFAYACFYGYFRLNAGTGWDEKSETTTINLIDILLTLEERPNFVNSTVASNLEGTEWQSLMNLPLVIGSFSKFPLVGRTPVVGDSYAQASTIIRNFAMGSVTQDYTGSGNLYLGTSPYIAAHVGETVKIKLQSTGEIISGTIVSSSGQYALSGLSRDTFFDTISLRSYKAGTTIGAAIAADVDVTLAEIITDDLDKIIDDHCWLKGTLHYYDAVTGDSTHLQVVQLNGLSSASLKTFSVGNLTSPPSFPDKTGFGVSFQLASTGSSFSGDMVQFNFAKVDAPTSCQIYFRDVSVALTDPVNIPAGTQWLLYATKYINNGASTPVLKQTYYINAVDGSDIVSNKRLFYRVGSGYRQIPTSEIYSVATGVADFGFTNLTKVVLNNPPSLANPTLTGVVDAFIYVDLIDVKRVNDVIGYLLGLDLPVDHIGDSVTCTIENKLSIVTGAAIIDETTTEVIDKILYESGFTLIWQNGVVELINTVQKDTTIGLWEDSGVKYAKVFPAQTIDENTILENSYSLSVGKLKTITANDYEYVSVFFNFSFPTSAAVDSNSSQSIKLTTKYPLGQLDRVFNYDYKYIHDRESAVFASMQFGMIGHSANIPETTRVYNIEATYDAVKFEALDIIEIINISNINGDDDISDPIFRDPDDGLLYYSYTDDLEYVLLPGLGIIESIDINFDLVKFVNITIKQCQFQLRNNLKEVDEELSNSVLANTTVDPTSTLDNPTVRSDGDVDGLCATVTATYPAPVTAPSPVILDPSKSIANLCCPSGNGNGSPAITSLTKMVSYCVGPFKPDLTPVELIASADPNTLVINTTGSKTSAIKGVITKFRGDAPITIVSVKVASPTLHKTINDGIVGVDISATYDSHSFGHGVFERISGEFTIGGISVDYNLFSGNGTARFSEIELQVIIEYSYQTYLQHVDLSGGAVSGDVVTERNYASVPITVSLTPLTDITES